MPSAAQTPPFSVGGDPRVDPADFEITVFASGLDSPLSMQELSDGSMSVGTDGGLLRLVDADDNGVADGPGTLPYTGTGGAVHSLR
jgi:glucose/arabinose dehydrogenase